MNEIGYIGGVPYHSHGDDHDHHEYLEHHHMCDYAKKNDCASKGTAGAGLGLGIAGTALGALAWLGGRGRRGGLFGGWGCDEGCEGGYGYGHRHEERHERHYEIRQAERISELQAGLAQQSAERFAEQKVFSIYRELEEKIDRVASKSAETDCRLAVAETRTAAKLEGLKEALVETAHGLKEQFKASIALEAERRECGDKELYTWANCTFAKNKKVIPLEDICPEPLMRYNAFKAPQECECDRDCGREEGRRKAA